MCFDFLVLFNAIRILIYDFDVCIFSREHRGDIIQTPRDLTIQRAMTKEDKEVRWLD